MNIEEIKRMAASSGADAWEITCRDRKDWEFYFIRHKLDQNRVVDVEHIDMKVYKKNRDQTLVGTASADGLGRQCTYGYRRGCAGGLFHCGGGA